jgi:hypothetical protein
MAVDAEAAVKAWLNARLDLVGQGRPIPLGAHLGRLRSPGRGAYAHLLRVGGSPSLTAESPVDRARVSATLYGTTKETACAAALAYATALERLDGIPTAMGPLVCATVDNITGPTALDDHESAREQYRYVVDADFYLIPAASLTP